MLKVSQLDVWYDRSHVVQGLDFEVRTGEIVGVAGVDGNGQRELAHAIAG
mgnify:CR=1 FL=1